MVKHIVLFQLKEDLSTAVRGEVMERFKTDIEKLPQVIEYIRDIHVGFNINSDEKWDICLESLFDSLEDVRKYSKDPRHVAVAGALKPYLSGRSCVDFIESA